MKKFKLFEFLFLKEDILEPFPVAECKILEQEVSEMLDITSNLIRFPPENVIVDENKFSIIFTGVISYPIDDGSFLTVRLGFNPNSTEVDVNYQTNNTPALPTFYSDPDNTLTSDELFFKSIVENREIVNNSEFIYENCLPKLVEVLLLNLNYSDQTKKIIQNKLIENLSKYFDYDPKQKLLKVKNTDVYWSLYFNLGQVVFMNKKDAGKRKVFNMYSPHEENSFLFTFFHATNPAEIEKITDVIFTNIEQKIYKEIVEPSRLK
jgi:hypothetical protein